MSRAKRRYYRTIFLGIAALGALVWAAVDQFDIPVSEMVDLFLGSILAIGLVIVLAALFVTALKLLQHLVRGRKDREG